MSSCKKSNGSAHKPAPSVPQSNELEDVDQQLLYNNYLQALYKRELVKLDIEKKKRLAKEQLSHYKQLLEEKQSATQKLDVEIDLLQKKSELIESLNAPEGKVMNIDSLSMKSAELKECLLEKCGEVKLKNIKMLHTQDEVDMLCNTLNNFKEMLEDIKNVTKNSEEVHNFAEQIENFLDLQQKMEESVVKQGKSSDELARGIITKLSNEFAERYDGIEQPGTDMFNLTTV